VKIRLYENQLEVVETFQQYAIIIKVVGNQFKILWRNYLRMVEF